MQSPWPPPLPSLLATADDAADVTHLAACAAQKNRLAAVGLRV